MNRLEKAGISNRDAMLRELNADPESVWDYTPPRSISSAPFLNKHTLVLL